MNYTEAIAYLNSFLNFENLLDAHFHTGNRDLQRYKSLLTKLGSPQSDYPIIHIAGTKGKGSTAAILESILVENGYKVGLYTSPHLISVRERIRINMQVISQDIFADLISQISDRVKNLEQDQTDSFRTVFEHLTTAGFLCFANENVDVAIIETGLGGRLDATNIVDPILSILTPVGLDHMAILGSTVEEIASDKVHIIKQNVPSVTAPQVPSVTKIIKERAELVNSELSVAHGDKMFTNVSLKSNYIEFDMENDVIKGSEIALNLNGSYQLKNLSTALCALSALKLQGFKIDNQATIEALGKVCWDGRFQQIDTNPLVIIDGAHNNFAVETVIKSLKQQYPQIGWRIVFSTLKNKPWAEMLTALNELSSDIYITPLQFIKSLDTTTVKTEIISIAPLSRFYRNAVEAFNAARKDSKADEGVLVIGSLYLTGEIMRIYAKLPPPISDGKIDDRI